MREGGRGSKRILNNRIGCAYNITVVFQDESFAFIYTFIFKYIIFITFCTSK